MDGELGRRRRRCADSGFENFCDAAVDPLASDCAQVLSERLLDQPVPEGQPTHLFRIVFDERRNRGGFQNVEHRIFVELDQLDQDIQVEVQPDDRCGAQHRHRVVAEAVDPTGDHVTHAGGQTHLGDRLVQLEAPRRPLGDRTR